MRTLIIGTDVQRGSHSQSTMNFSPGVVLDRMAVNLSNMEKSMQDHARAAVWLRIWSASPITGNMIHVKLRTIVMGTSIVILVSASP